MRLNHTNYRDPDQPRPGVWLDRGLWLYDVPRLAILCRLLGHRPVVDGVAPFRVDGRPARWVACDRCDTRPEPQGDLRPDIFVAGQPYRLGIPPTADQRRWDWEPGPFPTRLRTAIGAQVVAGPAAGFGISFKLGNRGSEQTLAGHLKLGLVAVYWHSDRHGAGWVRRFNPDSYHSRVTSLDVYSWRLWWRIWAPRDAWSNDTPRWRDGHLDLNLADRLLGPAKYSYTDCGEPTVVSIYLPHGDRHQVRMQLQKVTRGRRRGRARDLGWSASWEAARGGIPRQPNNRDRIYGGAVTVSRRAAESGLWQFEAAARLALEITTARTDSGWAPQELASAGQA